MDGTGTVSNIGTDGGADTSQEVEPKTEEQQDEGEALELELEEGKKLKVPLSKLPVEKLNPYIAKKRAEADRRLSEADRKAKEFGPIEKAVSSIKEDPNRLWELAQALGIPEDKLAEMTQARVARQIIASYAKELKVDPAKVAGMSNEDAWKYLQAVENAAKDPDKLKAIEKDDELERLRKEKADWEKQQEQQYYSQVESAIVNRLIIPALDMVRDPALREDLALELTPIIRKAAADDYDLGPEELCLLGLKALEARSRRLRNAEFTDEELDRASKVLAERKPKLPPPQHPAQTQTFGTSSGTPKAKELKNGELPPNTAMFRKIMGGKL